MMIARKELVFLNPAEVATEDRIETNLHSGNILVAEAGPDWGDAAIEAFMAQLEMGQIPIDSRWPNRQIVIPLLLGAQDDFDAARIALQAEVGRINEEGGWLKRELMGGTYGDAGGHQFADLVKANLKLSDDTAAASHGIDANAVLELEALPDFYGDPVVAGTFAGQGSAEGTVLVGGTMPARAELSVRDFSGTDQLGAAWAARCRNYSAAASWALEAEALTPLDSAEEASLTGASGGKVVRHDSLSTSWTPVLSTNLLVGDYLTHEGVYDVWTRAYTTSSTPPWLRLLYGVGDIISPVENEPFQLPGASHFYLIPLGQVDLRRPAILGESHRWQGIIQGLGAAGGENVSIDRLELFCSDESSGIPRAPLSLQAPLAGYLLRDEFNQAEHALDEQPLAAAGAVSAPEFSGTVEDSGAVGTQPWSNPSNAVGEPGGDYAEVTYNPEGPGVAETHYLEAKNFGLSIPEGATVTGIAFELTTAHGLFSYARVAKARAIKAGVVQATDVGAGKALSGLIPLEPFGGGPGITALGGPGNTFGTGWGSADLSAPGFGLALSVALETFNVLGTYPAASARVHGARCTVYYTDEGSTDWVTSGDATDLQIISASHTVRRTAVSDASLEEGRLAIAGPGEFANVIAQIRCRRETSAAGVGEGVRQAAVIRHSGEGEAENWLMGCFDFLNTSGSGEEALRILKSKEAEIEDLVPPITMPITAASSLWRYVWIEANEQGRILLWAAVSESSLPQLVSVVFDPDLATGGALASGGVGFYDAKTGAIANTREYDSFAAWEPRHDAVVFGGAGATFSHRGMFRQVRDGDGIAPISYPGSDLPRLPVSGPEERPVEVVVRPSRGDFAIVPDAELDPVELQVAYRPCWPFVPES